MTPRPSTHRGWRLDDMRVLCTGGSGFIGTHLIDGFLAKGIEVFNLDISEPKQPAHRAHWHKCNILDAGLLNNLIGEIQPSHVIHLAARATTEGKTIDDFQDNTLGTANVLEALKNTASVSRVVVASSQHVRRPGSGFPRQDTEYEPHGLYGQSKVITEKLTAEANLACVWTIIRPTTIWGPWHPFLPRGLWRIMKKGLYFHPHNDQVVRSYGYVKNVAWQIEQILQAPVSVVGSKIFYVGEASIRQIDWINAFSMALCNRDVRKVPRIWIQGLALVGDTLGSIGIRFPMNSQRYFNLTTTNPLPLEPILAAFGPPPYSLEQGIRETVRWLDDYGFA